MTPAAILLAMASLPAAVEVHPAGPTVPENLLRIELRFSRPQRLPFDVGRLRLIDADGTVVEEAFLDLALPNADARRITVLMNPGRVKTGVGPNVAMGRALHAGSAVRLVVDRPASSRPLVTKPWFVTAPVSTGPRPAEWAVASPRRRTRDELVVRLRAPISASAEALIAIRDPAGRRVSGRSSLGDGDTRWAFQPDQPWREGVHAIVVHPDLEDPAGNRVCAAFESTAAHHASCGDVTVAFAPRPRR